MSSSVIKSITEVVLVLHMVVAFPLVIIPTSQEFEEFLKIPSEFGWKRVAIRSSMMVFIIFAAESLPYFGKVRSLIGGSAVTLTCSVFLAYSIMPYVLRKTLIGQKGQSAFRLQRVLCLLSPGSKDGWMELRKKGWIDRRQERRMDGRDEGCKEGKNERRMDGKKERRMI
ncbi:amino acid transporter AVT1E [Caerostris extrusa]|uniref:Amino acid transporter AVT1E n=1 Tax=Caerostris extrusa TaxID=172846 RepID=A0AAV4QWD7_CAEEX|nr:amino acid transporter AVT1E [Caerostris extrusa]